MNNISAAYAFRGQILNALKIDQQNVQISHLHNDTSQKIKAYNNLAEDLTNLNRFNDAEKYLDTAFLLAKPFSKKKTVATLYLNAGNLFFRCGEEDRSEKYYLLGLAFAKQIKDTNAIINFAENYATLKIYSGKINDNVIGLLNNCIYLTEKNSTKPQKANLLSTIASAYNLQCNYSTAKEFYSKSISVKKQIPDSAGLAEDYINLAVVYTIQDSILIAKRYADIAYKLSTIIGLRKCIISAQLIKGNCYTAFGNYAEAKNLLFPAYFTAKTDSDISVLTFANQYLGNYYYEIKKYDSSLKYYNEALRYSILSNNDNYRRRAYFNLALVHRSLLQPEVAFDYLLEYEKLNDTIQNTIKTRSINEIATKYKSKEKDLQLKIAEQQSEQQRKIKNYFVTGTFALLLTTVFILYLLINKGKQNKIIAKERAAVSNLMGIMKHETARQFSNLSISLQKILSVNDPELQVGKAIVEVKTNALLYSSLFISSGKALISFKKTAEELFKYNYSRNLIDKDVKFDVAGDIDLNINGEEYLFEYLNELISNSLEHAFKNVDEPAISINIRHTVEKIIIEYSDNGCGITDLDNLIKPGKGMYYVKLLAENNLNGEFKTDFSNGSRFTLIIPDKTAV